MEGPRDFSLTLKEPIAHKNNFEWEVTLQGTRSGVLKLLHTNHKSCKWSLIKVYECRVS